MKPAGGKFAQYQERALGKSVDPIIYGPEEGFDPPIVIGAPNVDQIDQLNRYVADKDKLRILVAGKVDEASEDFDRLWDVLGEWELPAFEALVKDMWTHFFGKGATDVPGGSRRS